MSNQSGRPLVVLILSVLALLGMNLSASAQAPTMRTFPANITLPRKTRGEEAIKALGSRLPEVAAFYKTTPAELQKLLREDRSLWAHTDGKLFYACEIQIAAEETVAATNIGPTDVAPFSNEQTFHLHSRKGAGKVIYLDFDGHDASTTSWGADAVARPFDTDGNPNSFNATERDRIVYVWQRVAEDFAMYDIDITTEEPPAGGLANSGGGDTNYGIRVVIGGAGGDWYGSAGGVAQLFSFDDSSDIPCWVFPKSLGPDNEKYIAEAVSHEVGHTLGLSHDGTTAGVSYYQGQGNWAPIMGVGYYEPIAQWSKGEYANANNTQDDLAVMLNYGAAYRVDDHGNTNATATTLSGVSFSTSGVIERSTDLDFFRFTTGDGRVAINVNHAPRDSNLRLQVTLYDTNGTVLQVTNVADTGSGTQPVTLTAPLAAGTYFFSVDGIGSGNPVTDGYSDYASLGQYLITGTLPSDSTWLPIAGGTYDWSNTVNWASNTLPNGIGAALRINNNIVGDQTINVISPVTLGRLFLGDADSTHGFTIQEAGATLTFNNLSGPAILSKNSGTNDVLATTLFLQSDLVVTNSSSATLTFANSISGSGSMTKAGAGALLLEGAAAHSGGTVISAGTLALGASASLTSAVEIKSGAILDASALAGGFVLGAGQNLRGSGFAVGNFTAGSGASLLPGSPGLAGTLTFSNNLTLDDGATLRFDLAATDAPGGGTNDLIIVSGSLTLTGTINVDPSFLATLPASPGTYTLISYSGTLIGGAANFASVNYTNRYAITFDDTTPGEIRMIVSGAPANLVWKGDASTNRWDLVAPTNWLDGITSAQFQQLDTVTFDDTGSVSPAVNLSGVLNPLTVTVSSASNYTFSGSGKISGAASLNKQGTGALTLSTPNDFTGPVAVSAGVLKAGNAAALGATNGGTTIASGAQLDLNAFNLGAEGINVSGSGPGGAGAIINSSGAAQNNALRFVTLTGNTTFGGTGRWDIRANPTASLTGNNFSLTKTGANAIWLVDLANTSLGAINVAQGTLGIQESTTLGTAASNITVEAGATLALWNTDVNALNKKLVMNGGTLSSDAGDNIFAGTTVLNTNITISVSAGLEMQGVISGAGGFSKSGTGALRLTAANTFTGAVVVSSGALRAGNAACLGSTNAGTTIANNARLDVGGQNLGAEPITVTGDGLGNAGAIINEGGSQQNALRFVTLTGNTTFGGISRWDIRANPTASLTGNNRNLTKRGPNEVWLVDVGNTGLGAITVSEGTLGIQGTTTMGSAASNITVSSGTTLGIWATGTNILSKAMTLSAARIYNGSGTNTFAGTCSLSGSNTFDIANSTLLDMNGAISGSGSLWNITAGTLVLSSNNSYSGTTVINAGTLRIGNGGGFGTPGTAAITNNAALVFNRSNDFTVGNVIAGTGTLTKLGSGVLTLSGASTFSGSVTVNALNAGILRLRHNTALGTGVKTINLKSSGSPNSAGSFGIEVENNITLGTNLTWNISNDGLANSPNIPALRGRSGANTIAGDILIQTGGGGARIVSDAGSTLNLTGRITTDVAGGRDLFLDGAGSGVFNGTITNGTSATMFVNVNKEGSGSWTFSGTNTSGGATLIKAGTFTLTGMTGTNSLVVSNGATLAGTGIVRGVATVNGTMAPGPSATIGTLYVSNALALNGTTIMRLSKSPSIARDQIRGTTTLTYGGALLVTNIGGTFAEGDSFQLFGANAYSGAFASLTLPALAPPLTWSNRLTLDGSLLVARIPVEAPLVSSFTLNGDHLDLQFVSQAGVNYILEQTASLLQPITWSPISTNAGDGNVMVLSPPVDVSLPGQYFRIVAY